MPPSNATGGDLVDQLREWVDRQRERFAGRQNGTPGHAGGRRPTRRTSSRSQAVPMNSARATAGRPGRPGRPSVDRAARGTYTLILCAVLLVLIVAIAFLLWSLIGLGASTPSPTPVLSPTVSGQL